MAGLGRTCLFRLNGESPVCPDSVEKVGFRELQNFRRLIGDVDFSNRLPLWLCVLTLDRSSPKMADSPAENHDWSCAARNSSEFGKTGTFTTVSGQTGPSGVVAHFVFTAHSDPQHGSIVLS